MHDTFDTQRALRQATLILLALAAVIALALLSPADPAEQSADAQGDTPALVAAR